MILDGIGAAFFASEAIFEHEGSNPAIAKPLGQRVPFVAQTEFRVTAARTYDDSRSGRFGRVRNVGCERGIVNVAYIGAVDLLGLGRPNFRTRGAFGPKRKSLW
jgi:hypothetical protein